MIPDLICCWSFDEPAGAARISRGAHAYALAEAEGPIARVDEGPVSGHAAELREGQHFTLPRRACPALDIHGRDAQVSIVAWVRRQPGSKRGSCEAVAGMWNETRAKRQYCLFLNLRIHQSGDQVCGHVSAVGGPTPGERYCMDASIGSTPVAFDQWHCVGFTYDGTHARSYLDGALDVRDTWNPYPYPEGLFDGGDDGSDFTVGAVDRSGEMGNFYVGLLGGLAVFGRALSDEQMRRLATEPWPDVLPLT